ncbi:MAG: metallophosphoesterase family protein [Pseudomonadales bacterium]
MKTQHSKIGLLGDVHSEDERLEAALTFFRAHDINTVLCTGDIVDGPGDPNRCVELLQSYSVHTVAGNHERWLLSDKARGIPHAHRMHDLEPKTLKFIRSLPKSLTIECRGQTVMLCHGIGDHDMGKVWPGTDRMPPERSDILDDIIKDGAVQWLINGHLHFKTLLPFHNLTLINAGTLTGERWPGFSTLDVQIQALQTYEFVEGAIKPVAFLDVPEPLWPNTQAFTGDWQPPALYRR